MAQTNRNRKYKEFAELGEGFAGRAMMSYQLAKRKFSGLAMYDALGETCLKKSLNSYSCGGGCCVILCVRLDDLNCLKDCSS